MDGKLFDLGASTPYRDDRVGLREPTRGAERLRVGGGEEPVPVLTEGVSIFEGRRKAGWQRRRWLIAAIALAAPAVWAAPAVAAAERAASGGACYASAGCASTPGAPVATTTAVQPISATTVWVLGTITPNGEQTTQAVVYDVATSSWCTSSGASGSPAFQTGPQAFSPSGSSSYGALVTIGGLTPGVSYCAELVALNGSGQSAGVPPVAFTAGVGAVTTVTSYSTGATTATVIGTVDPAGQPTTYEAVYDQAASLWCMSEGSSGSPAWHTASSALASTAPGSVDVAVDIPALTAGGRYCAELVASNASGSASGGAPVEVTAGASAGTFVGAPPGLGNLVWASAATATSAMLQAYISAPGLAASYSAGYDVASSQWCASGGTSGTPAYQSASQALPTWTLWSLYEVELDGLTPGSTYCAEIYVTGAAGNSESSPPVSFTAGMPGTETDSVNMQTPTSAVVFGGVDPVAQKTSYYAQYDTSQSAWCQSSGASGTPAGHSAAQTIDPTAAGYMPPLFDDSQSVAVTIDGLSPGTSYCAAIVAASAAASSGAASPIGFTAQPVEANTDSAEYLTAGATTATVAGLVDPLGQTTTYDAQYALASSQWCQSDGASGAFSQTPAQPLGTTMAIEQPVTVVLAGLTGTDSYCAEIVAGDAAGMSAGGSPVEFGPLGGDGATAAPGPSELGLVFVQPTSATTAASYGFISSASQVIYSFQWALAGSQWCESDGSVGSPAGESAPQTAQAGEQYFDFDLTGFTGGQTYCVLATTGDVTSGPVSFVAGQPSAESDDVDVTAASTATIDGEVSPTGQVSTYRAAYGPASSAWCQTGGLAESPAFQTPAQTLSDSGDDTVAVNVEMSSLTPGDEYCAEILASNASATSPPSASVQTTFVAGTPGLEPAASGDYLTVTGATSATVAAGIDVEGQATSYFVQYDTAGSLWCESEGHSGTPTHTPPQTLPANSPADTQVTVQVGGLSPGAAYCAQLQATNASGVAVQFVDGPPTEFVAGLPESQTDDATSSGPTSATIDGSVTPTGQSSDYYVEYDLQSSPWCESDAEAGAPAFQTAPRPLAAADTSAHPVSVDVSGLAAQTAYCAAIVATNASGPSYVNDTTIAFRAGGAPGAPGAPVDLVRPQIGGSANVGQTLAAQPGQWSNGPTGYLYQWEDCDSDGSSCTASGPAGPDASYAVTSADVGQTISVLVIAINSDGAGAPAVSPPTSVVAPQGASTPMPAPIPPISGAAPGSGASGSGGSPSGSAGSASGPSGSGSGSAGSGSGAGTRAIAHAAIAQAKVHGMAATLRVTCPPATGPCAVVMHMTVLETLRSGRVTATTAAAKPFTTRTVMVGGTSATIAAGHSRSVTIALNATGRRLVKSRHRLSALLTSAEAQATLSRQVVTFTATAARHSG